mmetsp:Transcript_52698/g.98860  ORF Transcript_52698/g.98860 Transcript_52698/m.98860 type:complete len:767 (+) Transcript_52698:80-2380(+)
MCDKRLGYAFLLSFAAHVLDATTAACNKLDADAELTSLLQGRLHVEKPDFKNLESTNVPIDFVYCWAGETKRGPTNEVGGGSAEDHNIGYSFNEMQYSIRSLQVFVPWFNKVYLLVNGQAKLPAWAVGDSRIVMVDRCTLFPEKRDCPTMNSAACEAVMHRIPGLHEKFVMMQDDWFLLRKMSPSDFFSTSGRPRYAPPVTKDSLVEMYGPRKYLHGPHMPPEHVPDRLDSWSFTHRAMPMTVSFNMQLEKKFPDWFAFVRSHKTRFVCCNASIFGNGLDEEFLRVYPAMLYKLDAGDQLPKYSLKTAALHGTACNCENKECIKSHLAKLGAIAIQSCTAQGWRFASNLLDRVMENSKVAGAPPVSLLETDMETDEATGVRRAILASISAADVALALCACWVISSAWCSLSSVRFRFLGLTTFLQVVLLLSFIAFGVGHVFVMQRAGTTGYSLISATILIYVGKCVVSFLMFLGRTDLKAGFSTLGAPGCTRFGKVPAFILPSIPGGLLAIGDCLTFLSLAHLDPVTFQIFLHMRIVFVGLSWELIFRRKLSATQWLALLIFMVAGITKGVDRVQVNGAGLHAGICIVLVKSLIGALAGVFSEVLLKEMEMPTDLVNTCTYFWGLVWLVIVMMCAGGESALYSNFLSAAAWSKLQADPWMQGAICCLTVWGIIVAYFLKELSNIAKESAQAFVIIGSTILQWLLVGNSVITMMGMMGITMALLGVCVYSTDPLQNRSNQVDARNVPKLQTLKEPPERKTLDADVKS